MRRHLAPLALVLLLLVACGGGGDGGSPSSPTLAVFRGTLHVLGGTAPVAGGTVTVQGSTAQSAADGGFTIRNLQPGPTTVAVSATGYLANTIGLTLAPGDNFFSIAMEPTSP